MNVSQKISNILNYYQDNPGCDPNVYEFVELCYDMVQYLRREAPDYGIHFKGQVNNEKGEVIQEAISKEQRRQQYPIPFAVYDKFEILSQQLSQKLLGNELGITQDSPLYQLCQDLYISVGTYSAYGDTPLRAKLGGVSLFIAQKKRDVEKGLISDFTYDNQNEMEEIQRLNKELYDLSVGNSYVTNQDGSNKRYVESKPSLRQLLLEEIINEYQKGSKTR